MSGVLYGIGVGPGDPELVTLKAARLIAGAPVIAYPAANDGDSLARRIVAALIPAGAEELPIALPMQAARGPAQAAYDKAAGAIGGHLDSGRDVAVLCAGDPFLYGSFMYLFARLAGRHRTEVVPGVTSLTACAALLGRPLAARDDVLKVLPAPIEEARLAAELERCDAAAVVKVGRHFDKVRRVLRALGLEESARLIEAATTPDQRVTRLSDMPDGERPYFSTILVYRGGEGW